MKGSLRDRIPWLNPAKSDADTPAMPEEEATTEGTQEQEQEQGQEQPDGDQDVTLEQFVEEVKSAVMAEVRATLEPIIEVVQSLDGVIQTMDTDLTALKSSTTEQLQKAMSGDNWIQDLYIRSRDSGAAETKTADGQPPEDGARQTRELEAGESPSALIFGQDK